MGIAITIQTLKLINAPPILSFFGDSSHTLHQITKKAASGKYKINKLYIYYLKYLIYLIICHKKYICYFSCLMNELLLLLLLLLSL